VHALTLDSELWGQCEYCPGATICCGNVTIANDRRIPRNNDELSSWSYGSTALMAFPANTTLLEHQIEP